MNSTDQAIQGCLYALNTLIIQANEKGQQERMAQPIYAYTQAICNLQMYRAAVFAEEAKCPSA